MDEEKKQEESTEEKPEEKKEDVKDVEEKQETPEGSNIIGEANQAAERLAEETTRREKLLEREEKLFAEQKLMGRSRAGGGQPEEKKITDVEFANTIMDRNENLLMPDGDKQ